MPVHVQVSGVIQASQILPLQILAPYLPLIVGWSQN